MEKKVKIIIDGKTFRAREGQTILEVARENGVDIPALCFHPDLETRSLCRMCVVEIKEVKGLKTACSTKVTDRMEVVTDSPRIRKTRKINLELIFAQHHEECDGCPLNYNCQLLNLAQRYRVKVPRFPDRKVKRPVYRFGPITFDQTGCMDCRNCVDICPVNFLEVRGRGANIEIAPLEDGNKDCIYCGQCVVHCPVGAVRSVGEEIEQVEELLRAKEKMVIVQFAPAIRSSIGEEFGLPYGAVATRELTAGLKALGFSRVFDTCVGADVTTVEEADELVERLLKGEGLPMFTSCCPSWVKFVEFYYPEFIPHLTTARSPHIILGGLIKTYFAEREKIDPKEIVVVSIMPCVAKKYEITKDELRVNRLLPVDYVLTTRELAYLLNKHKVDLKKVKPENPDSPLGSPSGAGVIYGATGGVMESALRTAYERLTGKRLVNLEFQEVRGMAGIKRAEVGIGGRKIRVVVAHYIKNAQKLLEELKKKQGAYDYVEVMACLGGCIGGGGQPVPTDARIRQERAEALYQVDTKKKVRLAHENPEIKELYRDFLAQEKRRHSVCHTTYRPKRREVRVI